MPECPYEEGFLPITLNTRGARELSRHWPLSCLDLKSGFWQIRMDKASKQYTAFTVGNLGFFKCNRMPFGTLQCTSHLPMAYAELYG